MSGLRPLDGGGGSGGAGSSADPALQNFTFDIERANDTRGVLPTVAETSAAPEPDDRARVFLSDNTQEVYKYDGSDWALFRTIEPAAPHAADSGVLFGTVDADALLANLVNNQARPFHTGGEVTLTSAQPFGMVIDGQALANAVVEPLIVPQGIQGYLSRSASGTVTVSYATSGIREENLDHDTRYRVYATADNANNQIGTDAPFVIENPSTDQNNRFVTNNSNATYTVQGEKFDTLVTANFVTESDTGTTVRDFYIHDVSQPVGTRVAGATDGVFGGTTADRPASVVIPANTTVTLAIRTVSSGANQHLSEGSFLDFTQIIAPELTFASDLSGKFRVGNRHSQVVPIANTNTTTVVTGHNFARGDGSGRDLTLTVKYADATGAHSWTAQDIDVEDLITRFNNDELNDASQTVFDNDFVIVDMVDPATGEILLRDNGRDFSYLWSELEITASSLEGVVQVQNVALAGDVTTGTFQPLGDPNADVYTGANGDRVHLQYGDGNRDTFVLLDGLAREERQGFSTSDIEIRATDGQLEIRDIANPSGVLGAWYETKSGFTRTVETGEITSNDGTAMVERVGLSSFDVSVDPFGANEFLNNREPYFMVLAQEDTGGHTITAQLNGVDVTYENLENATDNGGGSVVFTGGTNQVFNKSANTVQSILELGDEITFSSGALGQFETVIAAFSIDPIIDAESAAQTLRVRLTGGGYMVLDENNVEVASGTQEAATYGVKRSYFGFQVSVNGITVYTAPRRVVDYSFVPPFETLVTAGADFDFSDTTFLKVPNLEFPVVAGRTYEFKFALRFSSLNATPDMQLRVDGPATATTGVTAYQSIENAISRTPLWGTATGNIAVAAVTNDLNADTHYAEGWLTANADGVVEISVRNNTGTEVQTVSALSWVKAKEIR